jgi:hypothetical protein
MSSYKRKEVFDYLTRKPVTTQDIELAKTRIQTPVTPAPMQVTSGEERVGYNEGSKLTGTGKTLEQNIKDDHKAFNDYRKSIGQSTIPLDNAFIRMWQRTRLSEGGRADFQLGGSALGRILGKTACIVRKRIFCIKKIYNRYILCK